VGAGATWKPSRTLEALRGTEQVHIVELDVTDTDSVTDTAAVIGGKVEILVNNASHLRPGGASGRLDLNSTRDEMDVNYFGALRLAGAFGPALRSRGADGDYGAVAWVNVLSVYGLVNNPMLGTYSASQAAALSLAQCVRSEMAEAGVRVVNALLGPLDDEWHQLIPPPKLEPSTAARQIVAALRRGEEDVAVGAVAQEILARFSANPKEVERAIGL
jgi:NAD(P)-dependent dehydrogenase (short-subunit alcohol dehydrogenase family)